MSFKFPLNAKSEANFSKGYVKKKGITPEERLLNTFGFLVFL